MPARAGPLRPGPRTGSSAGTAARPGARPPSPIARAVPMAAAGLTRPAPRPTTAGRSDDGRLLLRGQHADADHGVDGGTDHALRLLHDGHRVLDLLLGRLVRLGLRLGDGLRRVVQVHRVALVRRALQLQRIDDRPLLRELDHDVAGLVLLGHPPILDLAHVLEELDQLLHRPLGLRLQHQNRATRLLDAARVKVHRQRRVLGQLVLLQLRVARRDYLRGVGREVLVCCVPEAQTK